MEDHAYKKIEVVGTSTVSSDEAVRNAVAEAGRAVKELRWFEVVELRGDIKDGKIAHFQATVKIGCRLNG